MCSDHESEEACDSYERCDGTGQSGPETELIHRQEEEPDVRDPGDDEIDEMLGIRNRLRDTAVQVDQNEGEGSQSGKGGDKGRQPAPTKAPEPGRQRDHGSTDHEIEKISQDSPPIGTRVSVLRTGSILRPRARPWSHKDSVSAITESPRRDRP